MIIKTKVSRAVIETLKNVGCLNNLPESSANVFVLRRNI